MSANTVNSAMRSTPPHSSLGVYGISCEDWGAEELTGNAIRGIVNYTVSWHCRKARNARIATQGKLNNNKF